MSTKFGLLIDFDLLEVVISTNTKPEVVLSGRDRHLVTIRQSSVYHGFCLLKLSFGDKNDLGGWPSPSSKAHLLDAYGASPLILKS